MRFSVDITADYAFALAFSDLSPADYLASDQSPTHLLANVRNYKDTN